MIEFNLKQLQLKSDSWKRLLGFMMDENIQMKQRLTIILKDNFDKNLLEEVENFQSTFMKGDELISLFRNDVAELDKLLVREIFEDGKIIKDIDGSLERLGNDILNAERHFSNLKLEFNNFVERNIKSNEILET